MSIEQLANKQNVIGLWREFQVKREAFLRLRDEIKTLATTLKGLQEYNLNASQEEKELLTDCETKADAIK